MYPGASDPLDGRPTGKDARELNSKGRVLPLLREEDPNWVTVVPDRESKQSLLEEVAAKLARKNSIPDAYGVCANAPDHEQDRARLIR